jgi:pSer/pThr/pTyr-binding forkhead associated (FHA) protein
MRTVESIDWVPRTRPRQAVLMVCRGPNAGARFVLDKDITELGRHPDSDVMLDDITVGRRHAHLRRTEGGYQITDLGSLNGTYVNRERVHAASVGAADEIQIGRFRLALLDDNATMPASG